MKNFDEFSKPEEYISPMDNTSAARSETGRKRK